MTEIEKKELVGLEYMELMRDVLKRMLGDDQKNPKNVMRTELMDAVIGEIKASDSSMDEKELKKVLGNTILYLRHVNLFFEKQKGNMLLTKEGYDAVFDDEMITKVKEREYFQEKYKGSSWYVPIMVSLKERGGAAAKNVVYEDIIKNEKLSPTFTGYKLYPRGSVFENQVDWARNDLKDAELIMKPNDKTNPDGVWTLTQKGKDCVIEDPQKFYEYVLEERKRLKSTSAGVSSTSHKDEPRGIKYYTYCPEKDWETLKKENQMVIGWSELGDLNAYDEKEDIRQKLRELNDSNDLFRNPTYFTWEFAKVIRPGDVIYAKKDRETILARGVVAGDYVFDGEHTRKVEWIEREQKNPIERSTQQLVLSEISAFKDDIKKLEALFQDEIDDFEDSEVEEREYDGYSEEDFLNEVYMEKDAYHKLVKLLRMKKNVILQGAPGVGKTFAAKKLAFSMMGEENPERIEMVQFHQSYSYEDFVVGYRPTKAGGFEERFGTFYDFCKKVEADNKDQDANNYKDYFFIIDEINRGNLSKIFGELFMLIEHDKRGKELSLLYVNEKFSIPPNVYIIGMMNTADRSLAMMDYALRRRFAFYEFSPAFGSKQFKKYQEQVNNAKFNVLIDRVVELKKVIEDDPSLGRGFRIGHSYFCVPEEKIHMIDDEWIENVIDYELIPLLEEYWFDEPKKVAEWTELLNACKKEAK